MSTEAGDRRLPIKLKLVRTLQEGPPTLSESNQGEVLREPYTIIHLQGLKGAKSSVVDFRLSGQEAVLFRELFPEGIYLLGPGEDPEDPRLK